MKKKGHVLISRFELEQKLSFCLFIQSDSTPFGTDLIDTMPEKPEEEQQKEQQQQFSMFSHFSAKPSIETSSATAPFSWREEDLLQKKKLLKERVTGKESDTAPVVEKGSFGGFLDTFGYEEDKKEDTIKQQQQKLEENFQGSFNLSSPEKDKEVPKTSDESPVKMTPSRIIDNSDKSAAVTAMTTTSDWLAVEKQLSDMLIRDDNDDDKEKEKEEEEKYDDKKVTKPTESTLEIESTSKPTETVPYKVYKDEELTISTKYPVNTMPMPSPVIEPEEMAKFKSPYTHVFTLNSKTYNYYQHLHWPAGKMRCCDDCDFMHRLPRRMSNHYFSEHFSKTKDTEVECPWCEEHVNLHGDMLDHIEKHLINNDGDINEKFEEKDLICRFCLQKFESLLDVFRHTMSLDHLIWHSFMAARYCCRRFRWLLHPEEKIEEPVSSSVSEASSSVVSRSSSKAPLSRSPPLKPAIAKLHQQKHQHIKKPFSLDSDRASTRREPRISSDRSVSSVRSKHSLKSSSRPPLSPPLLPKSTRSDRSMSRGGIHSGSSVSSGRKSHYKETTQQVYSVRQKNLEKQKQRQQPLHFQKQLPRHEETPYISPSRESTIEEPIIPFSNKAYLDEDYDDYADSDFREDTESMSMRHSDPSSSETVASYRTPKIPSSVSEVDAESEVIPVSREEKAILLRMRAEREEEAMAVSKEEREILMQLRRQKQQEQQHYQSPPLSEVPSFYPSGTSQEQDYSFTSQSMEAPEFVPSSYIREEPSSLHQYRQRFPSGQQQQRQQRPRGRPPKNLHRTAAPFQPSHKPFRADSSAGRVISFGDPDPYGDIPAPPMYDDGDYYEAPVRHYQQPQPSQQQQQHQPLYIQKQGLLPIIDQSLINSPEDVSPLDDSSVFSSLKSGHIFTPPQGPLENPSQMYKSNNNHLQHQHSVNNFLETNMNLIKNKNNMTSHSYYKHDQKSVLQLQQQQHQHPSVRHLASNGIQGTSVIIQNHGISNILVNDNNKETNRNKGHGNSQSPLFESFQDNVKFETVNHEPEESDDSTVFLPIITNNNNNNNNNIHSKEEYDSNLKLEDSNFKVISQQQQQQEQSFVPKEEHTVDSLCNRNFVS
eukprot:TRINITY_DN76_c0_g3_i1.p1 TRINITY_DN76_c0_g3~~TRINITY_DN76_c0_g3_i1.p1  ORF type:complete len:1102 (-),score=377.63 TRINITY_DN76_c0_g3_i1:786-4091(-)